MANKLMIVESPNKCAKITSYLKSIDPDSTWDVEASVGHIQDLNKDKDGNGYLRCTGCAISLSGKHRNTLCGRTPIVGIFITFGRT